MVGRAKLEERGPQVGLSGAPRQSSGLWILRPHILESRQGCEKVQGLPGKNLGFPPLDEDDNRPLLD
jgi:hypothetical protein